MQIRPGQIDRPCKVCAAPAAHFGAIDFNRSCEDHKRGPLFPPAGVDVHYYRCGACGFLFTDSFDDWPDAEFQRLIYNADYSKVDPDYREHRPMGNAAAITREYYANRKKLRILDYGGGNGLLSELLQSAGFARAQTYDPFTPAFRERPRERFDVISSYETFEHLPDPCAVFASLIDLLLPGGVVLFSTLVVPASCGADWWYIAPRNGHVSSRFSARRPCASPGAGFAQVHSHSADLHRAYR
jgi:2-polyprenyl-6-hydroxyphenyl methylase/3-demethylubiquinone-9 3-methyltransferase